MKIAFLIAHAGISLLISGCALWVAVHLFHSLPFLGSDWFDIVVLGVGAATTLFIAGGAIWMLVVFLREEYEEYAASQLWKGNRSGAPRQTATPSASGVGLSQSTEGSLGALGVHGAEGGSLGELGSAGESCGSDVGGDTGCDSGSGGDSGGGGW